MDDTKELPELTFDEAEVEDAVNEKLPDWAEVPESLQIPPGRTITFVRFKPDVMLNKTSPGHTLILWPLTVREEKIAIKRARGEVGEMMDELTKICVRCVDGKPVQPAMAAQVLGKLWDEIGLKCVSQLRNWYQRNHTMDQEQIVDFYGSCIVVRSSVVTG
jgi:hypothetical protein